MLMKAYSIIVSVVFMVLAHLAGANQADDTTITITGHTAGATPFISNVTLVVSNTSVLRSIQFTIDAKPGSVTQPLSGTYANSYLLGRGFEDPQTGEVVLPVYGLYDGYNNVVNLTYQFTDGSSKQAVTSISTANFSDPCGYKTPTILQRRTNSTDLSYDYMMVKGSCSNFAPAIIDSDGALRWVGTAGLSFGSAIFFDNGVYVGHGALLTRIELDGAFNQIGDYSSLGILNCHHNIDPGKTGIILDVDTTAYYNSVNIEVDPHSGALLKMWNLADIISAAMIAGGDDPSQFVYPTPTDWFHNNGTAYNRADDSLIVSSRENFVICLDYETSAIKWILGDPTKKWYQFPSLRNFALTLPPGSLPPIGQHAPSITYDQNLLLFDNGQNSVFQTPQGDQRNYASPRKYEVDLSAKMATEIWNFEMAQSIFCPFCGSVYEDAPLNYLLDYAFADPNGQNAFAQLLSLNAASEQVFYYQYPTTSCTTAYRSLPIHLENAKFPTVGPQALNLSTRGVVLSGDNVLIGGFIITGTESKTMVLRALGSSLSAYGVSGALSDPILTVYNSSSALIATNDNWQSDPNQFTVQANGLAPGNPLESATVQTLAPGAYTVIVTGRNSAQGIALVELYDLSPLSNSKLANMSTRGSVGTLDNVLISGFIVGDVGSTTVVVRAIGPSLAASGLSGVLSDPRLTIYDSNGAAIATNDNWQDNVNSVDVQKNGLAPPNPLESALVLHLPAGAYTAIESGADGQTGIGLVEVYTIN
jgi:arylsulfate sulfotransferase